jgi:hypothetical protein
MEHVQPFSEGRTYRPNLIHSDMQLRHGTPSPEAEQIAVLGASLQ